MRYSDFLEKQYKMGDWFTIDQLSYFNDNKYDGEHGSIIRNGRMTAEYKKSENFYNEEDFNYDLQSAFPQIMLIDNYKNRKNKMKFYCAGCDSSFERAGITVLDSGCPKCRKSRFVGESSVERELEKLGLSFVKQESNGCINPETSRELKFDFIVEYNKNYIYIEVQGKQHYEPIDFFGGDLAYEELVKRDRIKKEFAQEDGIYIDLDYRESDKDLLISRLHKALHDKGVI